VAKIGEVEKLEKQQAERHRRWVEEEGGIEHPTHLETLARREQHARIRWLYNHCYPETNILDVGCNRGVILDLLNGRAGVDINPENVELARKSYPDRQFMVADVTRGLPFKDSEFTIVLLCDILEHIEWAVVPQVLGEALRLAKKKVLITLPWKPTEDFRYCFKHAWCPSEEHVEFIVDWLSKRSQAVTLECDGNFAYLEARR